MLPCERTCPSHRHQMATPSTIVAVLLPTSHISFSLFSLYPLVCGFFSSGGQDLQVLLGACRSISVRWAPFTYPSLDTAPWGSFHIRSPSAPAASFLWPFVSFPSSYLYWLQGPFPHNVFLIRSATCRLFGSCSASTGSKFHPDVQLEI